MKHRTSFFLLALACHACSAPNRTPARYELEFLALDDRGDAIADLEIAIGDTRIGSTDKSGLLRAEVNAHRGERFPLYAPCPDEYVELEAPSHVIFQDTKGLESDRNARIQAQIECARQNRVAALLVHADGHAGMPIVINGTVQGHTGPGGFAHIRLDLKPGAQFQVALDSSEYPTLRPIDPRRTMTLGSEDGLFLFDPVFSEAEPERKKKRRRTRKREPKPVTVKKRPVRVD